MKEINRTHSILNLGNNKRETRLFFSVPQHKLTIILTIWWGWDVLDVVKRLIDLFSIVLAH